MFHVLVKCEVCEYSSNRLASLLYAFLCAQRRRVRQLLANKIMRESLFTNRGENEITWQSYTYDDETVKLNKNFHSYVFQAT